MDSVKIKQLRKQQERVLQQSELRRACQGSEGDPEVREGKRKLGRAMESTVSMAADMGV